MTNAAEILVGNAAGVLGDRSRAAADRFVKAGLPDHRLEPWKFTSLRALEKMLAEPANAAEIKTPSPMLMECDRLVFVNGRFDAAQSTLPGQDGLSVAVISDSAAALENIGTVMERRPARLAELNTAALQDGAIISVDRNIVADKPIELLFLADGSVAQGHHPRLVIQMATGSELRVIERHIGAGRYFANMAVEIDIAANARLQRVKVQNESGAACHITEESVAIARDGHYDRFVLSTGAMLARDDLHISLDGSGSHVRLNGAYVGHDRQVLDHTTQIDHNVPHTTSYQVYKGVLDDRATGVFQGGVLVRPDAQKTDGHQLNKALLLSQGAEVKTKPALEIHADDVKCSHGSTVGELDQMALFYMKARGIPDAEARALLVQAFLDEVFAEIADEELREPLIDHIHAALAGRGGAS